MNDLLTEETAEKELDEILQPLIDLLDATHQASENCDALILIEITGGQMYRVESPYPDSVIIELPPGLHECKPLTSMVATLLQQSGSDNHWFDHAEGETDPYRTPLRFCIVKKTIWLPMEDRFSEACISWLTPLTSIWPPLKARSPFWWIISGMIAISAS